MESITPQRFIELLDNDFYVSLYNKKEEKAIGYRAIGKRLDYGKDQQWVAVRYESGIHDNLDELYESKPKTKTLYDELMNIEGVSARQKCHNYDALFRIHEPLLKSIIIEEV